MKKIKISILIGLLLIFTSSCGTIKEGFSSQKKNSRDEFLVEKKSPLVMPPSFGELPIPKVEEISNEESSNNIKSILNNSESTKVETQDNATNQNLEGSILKKIKKN